MGDTILRSAVVKAKTAAIKRNIQSDILEENQKKIKKLQQYMKDSKGENVTALKSQLGKEEQLVNGIGNILKEIMEYMNAACSDFEQLDQHYASEKVEK